MAVCNRTMASTLVYLDLALWGERWKTMRFQSAVQGSSGVGGEKMYCYGYRGMRRTDFWS